MKKKINLCILGMIIFITALVMTGCVAVPEKSSSSTEASSSTYGLPTLTATSIAGNLTYTVSIAGTSAEVAGNISGQGGSSVMECGFCWNTSGSPNYFNDSYIISGTGIGSFTGTITGLTQNTIYHVRFYAINHYGTVYSNEITFNSGKTFGTDFAGGYVFYNDGNGGGLVAAKENAGYNYSFSNITNDFIGTTGTAIGTGLANSNAIVAQSGHINGAAKACLDYTDGTYSDWYLPSKDEINLMSENIRNIAGFNDILYWSSSEDSATKAFCMNIKTQTGIGISADKSYSSVFVWAIRNF